MTYFDSRKCKEPKGLWCGKDNEFDKEKYIRSGSRLECLRKGIGVGMAKERKNYIAKNSLQNIKYIGKTYEDNFKSYSINTTNQLILYAKNSDPQTIKEDLMKICTKKNSNIDIHAYNSILMYLYENHIDKLPQCE